MLAASDKWILISASTVSAASSGGNAVDCSSLVIAPTALLFFWLAAARSALGQEIMRASFYSLYRKRKIDRGCDENQRQCRTALA